MAEYRCPKHDRIFTTTTDHRLPGSQAKGNFPAMPANGHPDCELCQADQVTALTGSTVTRGEGATRVHN